MRASLLAVLVLGLGGCRGCAGTSDDSGPDSGSTDTACPTGPTGACGNATLQAGPAIACTDPNARGNDYYEDRSAERLITSGAYLWAAGLVSEDFDGDGTLDLFIPGETAHQLWLTRPGPTPAEVTFEDVGLAWLGGLDLDYTVGGTAADLDDDGDMDLVLSRWERPNSILRNDGDRFVDITPPVFANHALKTQSATVGDIDGDGDLDVFFGNYGPTPDTYYDPAMVPAEPAELYCNCDTAWEDRSDLLPNAVRDGYTFMSGLYDLDGDHLPELFVANDFGKVRPSVLARNQGDFTFTADTSWHPDWEDMGMGVADLNGDRLPDFLLTSWKSVDVLASYDNNGTPLWVSSGTAWGIDADPNGNPGGQQVYGWGGDWGDVDNDGDLDAVALFGYWATYDEPGDPLLQWDSLWINVDPTAPRFEQRSFSTEWNVQGDGGIGRGFVFTDLNDDGWLDLVKREVGAQTPMYLSRCGASSWVRVRLQQPAPNRSAIGATIRAKTSAGEQSRWITAGSSGMYGGSPLEAHFGLGDAETVDRLEVVWPDGVVSRFHDVDARRVLTVARQ